MRVYSIFNSIDGEVSKPYQGQFSTFIRMAGCNLKCGYCDTAYAQSKKSGKEMTSNQVVEEVEKIGCKKVTITGGEPLLQKNLFHLLTILWFNGYIITVETNGSIKPECGYVSSWIMDWKLPSSGMEKYMKVNNFVGLKASDFVKFIISNYDDYLEVLRVMRLLRESGCHAKFALSPAYKVLDPAEMVKWMQEDKLFGVIVNLQLHKYIWPNLKKGEER